MAETSKRRTRTFTARFATSIEADAFLGEITGKIGLLDGDNFSSMRCGKSGSPAAGFSAMVELVPYGENVNPTMRVDFRKLLAEAKAEEIAN